MQLRSGVGCIILTLGPGLASRGLSTLSRPDKSEVETELRVWGVWCSSSRIWLGSPVSALRVSPQGFRVALEREPCIRPFPAGGRGRCLSDKFNPLGLYKLLDDLLPLMGGSSAEGEQKNGAVLDMGRGFKFGYWVHGRKPFPVRTNPSSCAFIHHQLSFLWGWPKSFAWRFCKMLCRGPSLVAHW